jgi:putative spermidine/putrescine transport system ATP-binding protein
MLDLALERVTFSYPDSSFAISSFSFLFERSRQTALIGGSAGGKSTLLRLMAGELSPSGGIIRIGSRDVTSLAPRKRPVFFATPQPRFPLRWSVEHVLIAALRQRDLSRDDRLESLDQVAEEWELTSLRKRPFKSLGSTDQLRVRLAEIDALRPPILLASQLFGHSALHGRRILVDHFYRFLRTSGITAIIEPAAEQELGYCHVALVLEGGREIQSGTPHEIHAHPRSVAAAEATGPLSMIPVIVDGTAVDSPIGQWMTSAPPFQGKGEAIVRPTAFRLAQKGEESDVLLAVEEAAFHDGLWQVRAIISGGRTITFQLSSGLSLHKGKLLPLRYDGSLFPLLRLR